MATKNILLVGVGGQGTILVSKILSTGLMAAGYDVKMSEVHGMAQRGGSVSTQVRYGEKVYSPIIGKGEADILVSFEQMEALRWLDYLKPDGKIVVNDYQIPSAPILNGKCDYPTGILETLQEKAATTIVAAEKIALALGNGRCMNVVLFGALVKAMDLTTIHWDEAMKEQIKPQLVSINQAAFQAGLETV
ncbi:MAG: indolepyruvate oxidoreductase subunit beta [Sporomusaceae bacterium]|nr:indolepyruvate oxidoreductase subunit beta [Sporomusaceae bacterium]